MTSAITTVFSTHELLECILLQVDLRTLLTSAQRVNRTWYDLVRSSLPLQRTLFFAAQDDNHKNSEYTYNPLLTNAFPTFFQSFPGSAAGRPRSLDLNSLEMVLRPDKQTAYLRAEASWRKMLTRQPPVRSLLAVRVTSSMAGQNETIERLEVPEGGLRMGRVFELVMSRKVVSFEPITHNHLSWNPGSDVRGFQGSNMRVNDELRRAVVEADALLYSYHVVQCTVRWEDTAETALQRDLARGYGKINL